MRVNKFLGQSGNWSRREADELVAQGRVTINGTVADIGAVVEITDEVKVDGEVVGGARKLTKPVYIALNKPVGITCTTERSVAGNIVDFVDHAERIFPIGRLDKDSEGLIIMTNDGDIVNQVLRVENAHEKEYLVAVDRSIDDEFVSRMSRGIRLQPEGWTKPCKVRKLGPKMFAIVLTQGLNRQIRRMSEACGYRVMALRRIRFLHIELGNLAVGRWRNLTDREVSQLLASGKATATTRGPVAAPGGGPTRSGLSRGGPTRGGPVGSGPTRGGPAGGGPAGGGPRRGGPAGSGPTRGGQARGNASKHGASQRLAPAKGRGRHR